MELKDNFTNRYFKPDMVKSQIDMINQPTGADAIAEGFQKYSQLPASNAYAELDNMTMSAIGDGMKSTANNKRQEQIDPILKMTGQINAQAAYLEAQMQGEQEETAQVQQFVKSQSFAFSELAKASTSGDSTATNNIARGILQQYKNTSGDPIIGDFDHYHDGNIYYSNAETGEKGGLSVSQLISQSGEEGAQSLGADYPMIMSAFSTGFKGQYENTQELQRLERDKQQANINNTNAKTGLYGSQAGQNKNKSTPEYQKQERNQKGIDSRSNHNSSVLIPEISAQYQKNNEVSSSITEFKDILNKTSLAGGSGAASAMRFIAQQTGNDESIVNAENAGQFYFEWMSENSKGALSDRDMENYKRTFASIDKNPKASINILDRLDKKLKNQNSIFMQQLETYEQDPTANLHSLDILNHRVEKNSNEANTSNNQTQDMVQVRSPSGKLGFIPRSALPQAKDFIVVE
jgi:hypothetical protein